MITYELKLIDSNEKLLHWIRYHLKLNNHYVRSYAKSFKNKLSSQSNPTYHWL